MVGHVYNGNTQEAGERGSRKTAKFTVTETHHFLRSGHSWGKKEGRKLSGGRDGFQQSPANSKPGW